MSSTGLIFVAVTALLAGLAASGDGRAQALAYPDPDYPTRPVRIVVPYPAGGVSDIRARQYSARLSEALRQSVVVENRAGASGVIGADWVAKSAPDGYTLLLGSLNELALTPALGTSLPFEPLRDLVAISLATAGYPVLLVSPSLPVFTLESFLRYAKSQPGKINVASPGATTHQHFVSGYFAASHGLSVTLIPYKGSAPAFPDLMTGQVQAMLAYPVEFNALARSDKVRPLAIFGPRRAPMFPDVPTIAEAGSPGHEVYGWQGFFAPAATPPAIIRRLNAEIVRIGTGADLQKILSDAGSEFITMNPTEFGEFVRRQSLLWRKIVTESGVPSGN